MKALIQRVNYARVEVGDSLIGEIDKGLLVFLGVEKADTQEQADQILHKLLNYRVFADAEGKMNLSISDVAGGMLIVSQFTLAAETHKGMRPGFSAAAAPEQAKELYEYLLQQAEQKHQTVACGEFGADMQVSLQNDGPVTFLLES